MIILQFTIILSNYEFPWITFENLVDIPLGEVIERGVGVALRGFDHGSMESHEPFIEAIVAMSAL